MAAREDDNRMKIFVYGSLRTDFLNYDKVLKNRVKSTSKGKIKGELYHLPEGYPAVLPGKQWVYGEVFTLSKEKILRTLDLLEGYLGEGQDNLYIRENHTVMLENGQEEECFTYIYVNQEYAKKSGKKVVDGDWKTFIDRQSTYKK